MKPRAAGIRVQGLTVLSCAHLAIAADRVQIGCDSHHCAAPVAIVPEESVTRLRCGDSSHRPEMPILNSKLVGGPGFEPGVSRPRTVLVACPPVSRRLPTCPPELKLPLLNVRLCPPRAAWCRESVPRLCPGACLKRRGT